MSYPDKEIADRKLFRRKYMAKQGTAFPEFTEMMTTRYTEIFGNFLQGISIPFHLIFVPEFPVKQFRFRKFHN